MAHIRLSLAPDVLQLKLLLLVRGEETATVATAYEIEASVPAPPTAADGGMAQIAAARLTSVDGSGCACAR